MNIETRFLRVSVAIAVAALALAGCNRRQTNRAIDPTNELPFGVVDGPKDGSAVPAVVTTGGWALDDRGIREVRIYVDGHFANVTPLNTPRPDVVKAYPQYARGSDVVGFTTTVEFTMPGPHTIVVQAVDTDGATRDIGSIKVTSGS
jgi:hypothetical protein